MNGKIKIKVGDYIFNKDDVKNGISTILFRVDEVTERELETLVDAYCLETSQGYSISVRHDKDEWGVIPAETMKGLCA